MIQLEKPAELVSRFQRFAALADRREAPVTAAALGDFAGEYKFLNRTITISLRGNRLWLGLPDTPEKPLFASSSSRFFVRTTETELQFERDPAGKIVKLVIFNSDGNKIECPRT